MFNEVEGCGQYQKVAVSLFKNGLDESAREAYQDFYLHPPKDMEDLMVHINQHCQITEDMAAHWKTTGGEKLNPVGVFTTSKKARGRIGGESKEAADAQI